MSDSIAQAHTGVSLSQSIQTTGCIWTLIRKGEIKGMSKAWRIAVVALGQKSHPHIRKQSNPIWNNLEQLGQVAYN